MAKRNKLNEHNRPLTKHVVDNEDLCTFRWQTLCTVLNM